MTKVDIVNKVSERAGLQKPEAEQAVEMIISLIKSTLGQQGSIILRRFGSFQIRHKKARVGRNPKTGEEAAISERNVVRFKAGKYFKTAINV